MGVLLRRTKKKIWSGEPPDEERRQEALAEFRRSAEDTDGLSVFEVASDEDRELVVAAIACDRASDNPIDLLEIPREVVEQYGEITSTAGVTALPAANRLHRSLDWDPATLERLATDLFNDKAEAQRVKTPAIRTIVGKLAPDQVEGERAKAFVREQRERALAQAARPRPTSRAR